MDAVSNKNCAVYFGGRYYENWSEDYTLSIKYENRRQVLARCQEGRWIPVAGDEGIRELLLSPLCPPLMQEYFQTAATVYTAISACLARGLELSRLNECFQSEGKPLAAPELMRLLMDDCGLPLEEAYRVTGACCDDLSCTGIQAPDRRTDARPGARQPEDPIPQQVRRGEGRQRAAACFSVPRRPDQARGACALGR